MFQIREANDVIEVDRLLALKAEVATQTYLSLGIDVVKMEQWLETHNHENWWINRLLRPEHRVFLVEMSDGGSLVGVATATVDGDDPHHVYLGSLYCRIQGVGIGAMLMRQRLVAATEWGATRVSCNVLLGNERACRFVEHYGFHVTGMHPHDIFDHHTLLEYSREPHV